MSFKIETNKMGDFPPTRIEGWCDIPGWSHPQSVIAFSTIHGKWHTGSSMCLPSDIRAAKKVQECVAAAFDELDKYI